MADSEELVELLFFDTFSHDINEVKRCKSMVFYRMCWIQVKFCGRTKIATE